MNGCLVLASVGYTVFGVVHSALLMLYAAAIAFVVGLLYAGVIFMEVGE